MTNSSVRAGAPAIGPLGDARLAVLQAVRGGAETVNVVAAALGVTDNAVRGHLAALERDGLVRERGVVRRGEPGKPARQYEATLDADVALSRAYAKTLAALVEGLARRLSARQFRGVLADAGRRLVPPPAKHPGTVEARVSVAAALLESLGGSVRATVRGRVGGVEGDGCPLAAAVAREPDTCLLVRELLAAHTGRAVAMQCHHGMRPRCAFEIR